MGQRSVTREVPKQSRSATFEPSTVDAVKRTVDLVWTTGARVLRGYYDPYFEELSLDPKHVRMERLQSGSAPLLNSHSSYAISDVLGVIERASLTKTEGRATVRFDSGPDGEDAFRRVREGTLRNVSVGYTTYKMQQVEGGKDTTPVFRAVDWEPAEISLVPIGADAAAGTRAAVGMTRCEFIQERDMDPADAPTVPTTTAPAIVPAPIAPSADVVRAAALNERTRTEGIRNAARALKRPESEVAAAIEAGTSLDAYRAAAIDAHANGPAGAGGVIVLDKRSEVVAGEDAADKMVRGMTNWIFQRSAVAGVHQEHAKQLGQKLDLDPGEFRGMKLLDMARVCLERAGVSTKGMTQMELAGTAFTTRGGVTGGLASTSDFPMILENALYKTLLAQYAVTPDTWSRFCMVGSTQDFRANKRYRLGTFGSLDAVNEAGEFKSKSIPDAERQSITVGTKGNIIGITRQAVINDDMGAFASLATMLGRAAKLTVEQDVYSQLALNAGLGPVMNDGLTLFHATHKNIGTGAAIGSGSIDADRVLMGSQTDPSGNEILNIRPEILLLNIGLGGAARQINTGQYDFDASASKNPWLPNRVGGIFRDIIDTARVTGTRRYLFADPGVAPVFEVAFLDGQQQPFLDVQQGWRVDGFEWKVRLDYGVAPIDFRGAVTNAGV